MKTRETTKVIILILFAISISLIAGLVKAQSDQCEKNGALLPENVEIIHGCLTEPPNLWKDALEATVKDFDVFYLFTAECNPPCVNGQSHGNDHGIELVVSLSSGEWFIAWQGLLEDHFLIDGDEFDTWSIPSAWPRIEFDGSGACDERNFMDGYFTRKRIVANCDTSIRITFSDDYPMLIQMFYWQTKDWDSIK